VFRIGRRALIAVQPHRHDMSGGSLRGGRYESAARLLIDLNPPSRTAWTTSGFLGGPNWLETDRFDGIAKAPSGATADSAKLMRKALLADRFGLVLHQDNKPVNAFVLSAARAVRR